MTLDNDTLCVAVNRIAFRETVIEVLSRLQGGPVTWEQAEHMTFGQILKLMGAEGITLLETASTKERTDLRYSQEEALTITREVLIMLREDKSSASAASV